MLEYRRVSKNDGSQHGGLGLAELRAVRAVWPSRRLTRRWHPSCHWRMLKPKESLGGNDWNEKREDITINVYRFLLNQ